MVAESVVCIILDSFHEFIREEDGNVHRRQLFFILFDMQEFIDVRMIAVQSDQHGAASSVLADDLARGVEDLEEGNRAGRGACYVVHTAFLRTQVADVHTDAAAIGKNLGNLAVDFEDGFNIV